MARTIRRYGQVSDDGGQTWVKSQAGKGRMKVHVEQQREATPVKLFPPRKMGRARYTVDRFFEDCCEETINTLRKAWEEGDQLASTRVPIDGLPCVLLLATYARLYGVSLVDDYDALIERYQENVGDFSHNDKFFSGCICILYARGQYPGEEAFESINIPAIYEELLP